MAAGEGDADRDGGDRTAVPSRAEATIVGDVSRLHGRDLGDVDALARLCLVAVRIGVRLRIVGVCDELRDLLAFAGLDGELLGCAPSAVEACGQPEQREVPLGVEEGVQTDDPTVGDLDDLE